MVRRVKPFGVRVGKLRDRLEALSYRDDPSLDRKFNRIVPAKETLNKSFNHEWTRMNTNEIKASNRLIRVGSCSFVVKSALP